MTGKKSIAGVYPGGLCMGCGVCAAACPAGAIHVAIDRRRGLWRPIVDETACTSCGQCLRVCGGVEVDFPKLARQFLGDSAGHGLVGVHRACYFAHAIDDGVRYQSTSGGLVTALLLYALDQDLVDAALVVRMSDHNPLEPEAVLAATAEEVVEACGSKYCPTTLARPLREIAERDGRFAVVGLPCHMHSIRKWEAVWPAVRRNVRFHFGILCAANATFLGTEYFLRRHGIDPRDVDEMRYRDKGWPGSITVRARGGAEKVFSRRFSKETGFRDEQIFRSAFQLDFRMPRCLMCPDLYAELADISFGDAWHPDYLGKDTVGKSLVIARTAEADDLLHRAAEAGAVDLTPTDAEAALASQNVAGKASVASRLRARRRLRRTVPDYPGRSFPKPPRGWALQKHFVTSYFTHHRWTWCALPVLFAAGKASGWIRRLPRRAASKLFRALFRRHPADQAHRC